MRFLCGIGRIRRVSTENFLFIWQERINGEGKFAQLESVVSDWSIV